MLYGLYFVGLTNPPATVNPTPGPIYPAIKESHRHYSVQPATVSKRR